MSRLAEARRRGQAGDPRRGERRAGVGHPQFAVRQPDPDARGHTELPLRRRPHWRRARSAPGRRSRRRRGPPRRSRPPGTARGTPTRHRAPPAAAPRCRKDRTPDGELPASSGELTVLGRRIRFGLPVRRHPSGRRTSANRPGIRQPARPPDQRRSSGASCGRRADRGCTSRVSSSTTVSVLAEISGASITVSECAPQPNLGIDHPAVARASTRWCRRRAPCRATRPAARRSRR